MKPTLLILTAVLFSGCVTDRQGRTQFDVDKTIRVLEGAREIYDRYQRTPAAIGIQFRTDPAPAPEPPCDDECEEDEEILIDPPGAPFPLIVTRHPDEP